MRKFFGVLNTNDISNFFPKLNIHVDGFSLQDTVSLRLSNIPKNIGFLTHSLFIIGKQVPVFLFSALLLLARNVQGKNCAEYDLLSYNNIYLNHSLNNSFLMIKYSLDLDKSVINGTCDFIITENRLASYQELGCACKTTMSVGEGFFKSYDKVFLYGQNLTDEMFVCMQNFFNENCYNKPWPISAIVGFFAAVSAIPAFFFLLYCCRNTLRKAETPSDISLNALSVSYADEKYQSLKTPLLRTLNENLDTTDSKSTRIMKNVHLTGTPDRCTIFRVICCGRRQKEVSENNVPVVDSRSSSGTYSGSHIDEEEYDVSKRQIDSQKHQGRNLSTHSFG